MDKSNAGVFPTYGAKAYSTEDACFLFVVKWNKLKFV